MCAFEFKFYCCQQNAFLPSCYISQVNNEKFFKKIIKRTDMIIYTFFDLEGKISTKFINLEF